MNPDVAAYVTGGMHGVRGYLARSDAWMMAALVASQRRSGADHALGEIGIFHGRSYYLLALLARPEGRVMGCDLFPAGRDGKQFRSFAKGAKQHAIDLRDDDIFACKSRDLDADALLEQFGPFGLLHIDGNHRKTHVVGDADLAAKLLDPAGIVVFDDFCEPMWPEVTEGVYDFLHRHGDFAIFAISRKKAYIARADHADRYADVIRGEPRLARARLAEIGLGDRKVPFVSESFGALVMQRLNDRLGRGLLPVPT